LKSTETVTRPVAADHTLIFQQFRLVEEH